MFDRRKNFRGRDAENNAKQSADGTERNRFDQELGENVAPVRADGHARADFARPFGYAHEHDVHDADAANDQRNARNRAEQSSHDVGRRRCRLRDFLLIAHGKIVVATRPGCCVAGVTSEMICCCARFEIGSHRPPAR